MLGEEGLSASIVFDSCEPGSLRSRREYRATSKNSLVPLNSLVNSRLGRRLPQLVVKDEVHTSHGTLDTCKTLTQRLRATRKNSDRLLILSSSSIASPSKHKT